MYSVLIKKPEPGYLPTVINQNANSYPDFMMQNYFVIHEGTEKECQSIAEEMIQEFIID